MYFFLSYLWHYHTIAAMLLLKSWYSESKAVTICYHLE